MTTVTSPDGTRIAYDDLGDGPPLIVIGGALNTRADTRGLAEDLADRDLRTLNPDRRGRGDSDDASSPPPWDPMREVEDIAALIEAAGGRASLYGHSSGAAVALRAAAELDTVDHLILNEPPYALDDTDTPRRWSAEVRGLVGEGRGGDAVVAFVTMLGMPAEMAEQQMRGPHWDAIGMSLPYDSAAMGDENGSLLPVPLAERVTAPTLVLAGGADFPFMVDVARTLTPLFTDGTFLHLEGHGHDAGPDVVGPPVADFVLGRPMER